MGGEQSPSKYIDYNWPSFDNEGGWPFLSLLI